MIFLAAPDDNFVENIKFEGDDNKGGSKLVIIIMVLNTLIVIGALVYFIVFYQGAVVQVKTAPDATESGEQKAEDNPSKMGVVIEMEPFVVNLNDPSSAKYLRVGITIEVDDSVTEAEMLEKKVKIKDTILTFLSSLSVADTVGLEGKASIKEGLINRINNVVAKGKVKNVYFTEFVVQ